MRLIVQRFGGIRQTKDMRYISDNSVVVLIPRRDFWSEEVIDYMRFDKTDEIQDGLPVFVQSAQEIEAEVNGKMVKYPVMHPEAQPSSAQRENGETKLL